MDSLSIDALSMDGRFAALLDKICSSLPEEHDIRANVRARLERLWDAPRADALAELLGKPTSLDDARRSLFFPTPNDAAQYAKLILDPPADSPADHPQVSVQGPRGATVFFPSGSQGSPPPRRRRAQHMRKGNPRRPQNRLR